MANARHWCVSICKSARQCRSLTLMCFSIWRLIDVYIKTICVLVWDESRLASTSICTTNMNHWPRVSWWPVSVMKRLGKGMTVCDTEIHCSQLCVICESKVCSNPARRRMWCTILTCACLVNEKHDYAIEHVHVLLMPQMKSDLVRWHSECINLRTIFIAHKFEIKWAQWCIAVNKHMSLCNVARSLWSRSYSTRWNWMYLPAMLNSNGIRIRDETRTMIWLIEWNTHMCKFVHTKQDFATSWYWMLCV